uniref:Microtubule integrity protein mal3 n=1 Tax=Pyricularia oryzae (strain P131) TaxID=1143193 RepID=L7JMQ2_PYRO1
MGESRLLQLNITKVEQCGTGAALCQVFDSIFLDVPMSRVKFNVNSEYAYIQNFKVLQSGAARRAGGTTPTTGAARAGLGVSKANPALAQENATLKETVVGLERERDFYFSKLRDIELLVQNAVEEDPEIEKQEDGLVKQIQAILYSTEEGFEIPAEGEVDDQETF